MARAMTTTDHDRIRAWAEKRGGHPAHVKRTGRGKNDMGILRIDFPGFRGGSTLEEISWDQFFDAFDQKGLAFIFQEKTATGRTSRFGKFVDRGAIPQRREAAPRKSAGTRKTARTQSAPRTAKKTGRRVAKSK